AAFQSHLWNQVLASLIRQLCREEQLVSHPIGGRAVPFFTNLDDEQQRQFATLSLPLPSARLHFDEGPLKSTYDRVMASGGLALRQVRVKYPRDSFFSKGERAATVRLDQLQNRFETDDLYEGRQKLVLGFNLPRGSYATILVKQIAGGTADLSAQAD